VAEKKKEGLFSFGQGRGMIERGMREVVAGSLWQLLCQVKRKTLRIMQKKKQITIEELGLLVWPIGG
jgi:hypothetical protein